MSASYPSAIWTPTTKTDKVDLVAAAHINDPQNEIVAIETELGTLIKGTATNLKTRLAVCLFADGSVTKGSAFPASSLIVANQLFYRTDLEKGYIRNYANTNWLEITGTTLSNLQFCYIGAVDNAASGSGELIVTTLNSSGSGNYRYLAAVAGSGSYNTVWTTKWTKLSGVNTLTVYVRIWSRTTGGAPTNADFKMVIGSVNNHVLGSDNTTSPEWKSFTLDVSALTNGTVYDVTSSMKDPGNASTVYVSDIIAYGS